MKARGAWADRGARAMAAAGAFVLAACAAGPPRVLRLEIDPARAMRTWPHAPEVPRYRHEGTLLGEANYLAPGEAAKPAWRSALEWAAGLGEGRDPVDELLRPAGGASEGCGRIVVSDPGRGGVFAFRPEGGPEILEFATGSRRFVSPTGIACGPGGSLFVADSALGYVVEFDEKGGLRRQVGAGILRRPTGLAFDRERAELYVADTASHDVKVFDAGGRLLRRIGGRGEAPGEFNFPTHLWFRAGDLYVSDTMNGRVQVFARGASQPRLVVGSRGLNVGQLVRPKGVATDSAGNIYVVESYYDHLLVYDREGRFLLPIGGLGQDAGQFYLPAGLWVDERDRVFVADMFNGRVVVLQFLGGEADGQP
ncbi:MAG: 6-bladed beta-propeller [Betaproteobacteria bacterium]|nr:6-bladed beta-propeller [Betaproteobacteria bacterium]